MTPTPDPAPISEGGIRWGILATGSIARTFARDLTLHGHRVTAVGSRSLATATDFATDFDIPHAHGSYADLVADAEVDAIYVATPHTFHAANATAALEHGKHVLVEKAFTINADEAREVVALGRERGLVVLEAMWTRFLPPMAFVRQVIAELKKVVRPTRSELLNYTWVVIVFVAVVMAFVTVLDLGIGTAVGWIFGG